MADFQKHRLEQFNLAIGFADRLTSGDSVASVNIVEISRLGASSDLSSEFGSPSGTVNGDDVELTLSDAASGDQSRGIYTIFVEVDTSDGDTLVAQDSGGNLPTVEITTESKPA